MVTNVCMDDGTILTKMAIVYRGMKPKLVMHGYNNLYRGNLNANGNCNEGKLVMHGYKRVYGAILTKINILERGK